MQSIMLTKIKAFQQSRQFVWLLRALDARLALADDVIHATSFGAFHSALKRGGSAIYFLSKIAVKLF